MGTVFNVSIVKLSVLELIKLTNAFVYACKALQKDGSQAKDQSLYLATMCLSMP